MRKVLAVLCGVLVGVVVLWAADGPLTPMAQLRGRTDGNGYLMAASGTATGSDGPLTPIGQLRGRTDGNGYLRVALSGASGVSSLTLASTGALGWSSTADSSLTPDVSLFRDAADVLAQRRGTNAQEFRVANTCSGAACATGYEYASSGWAGNTYMLTTVASGTGTVRDVVIGAGASAATFLRSGSVNRWALPSGGGLQAVTDNSINIGATGTGRPAQLFLGASAITQGAATGLTISDTGSVRTQVYKVTVATTAFICNAVTCDLTIGTLPANTWVTGVTAQLTTTFACSAVCTTSTLSFVLGKGAGGAEYLASWDADATTGYFGDADAELGTLMVRAAAIQGGTFTSGTQAVVLRLTSGTGNVGNGAATNLSQGALTIWITTTVLP